MQSKSNNASSLRTLLRIFRFRRSSSSSSPKSKSQKEASTFLFRAFFSKKSSPSHKKQPKKTKKNLKKMMRKMRRSSSSSSSSDSIPALTLVETFETASVSCSSSISSPTKSPSIASFSPFNERTTKVRFSDIVQEYDAVADDVSSDMDSYDNFEEELFVASKETLQKFPELRHELSSAASSKNEDSESRLAIDCSASIASSEEGVATPPSSNMALFGGEWPEWCDWSAGSASPLAQYAHLLATAVRSQDIFRPTAKSLSPAFCWDGADADDEDLSVRFNPSFDGIEMVRSFDQPLATIEEEPSAIELSDSSMESPKVYNFDETEQENKAASHKLFLALFLFFFFAATEAGVPMANIVGPKMLAMLTRTTKAGPAPIVPNSFFNTHHTPIGVWLK